MAVLWTCSLSRVVFPKPREAVGPGWEDWLFFWASSAFRALSSVAACFLNYIHEKRIWFVKIHQMIHHLHTILNIFFHGIILCHAFSHDFWWFFHEIFQHTKVCLFSREITLYIIICLFSWLLMTFFRHVFFHEIFRNAIPGHFFQ